ncbi:hypothetical protein MJO28_008948 [Puccinia striiformis f. sp. tritici]|uniref:Uncharacterized protein n=1 Tax=Puccinia striiformis f. sp. tritici TaxID=168172 RepID=A0ACC0EE64_9BASI|nr:hypothetical protein MJO28_008948 [Puccinia striiformis f. sp. tritici]
MPPGTLKDLDIGIQDPFGGGAPGGCARASLIKAEMSMTSSGPSQSTSPSFGAGRFTGGDEPFKGALWRKILEHAFYGTHQILEILLGNNKAVTRLMAVDARKRFD